MSGVLWSKFFWPDWNSDPSLRLCSMAAQGFWMRLLCIAAEADPIGYVTVNGQPLNGQDLARMTGVSAPEAEGWLSELERNGVFSRDRKGRIYSRRMVREEKAAATARKNGRKGGNPTLRRQSGISGWDNPPVNPPLKPHKPESRIQKAAASHAGAREGPPAAAAAGLVDFGKEGEQARRRRALSIPAADLYRRICERLGARGSYHRDGDVVVRWLANGYDPDLDVMAAVERVLARDGPQLPTSLAYFDAVIADVRERRLGRSNRQAAPPAPSAEAVSGRPSAEDLRRKLVSWAKGCPKWARDDPGRADPWDWPVHARWDPRDPVYGPPPGHPGCRAPPELVAEVLGQFGVELTRPPPRQASAR